MGIHKLLIANRGEIACRVIATARKLGITTVAVYSDADRAAKHVRMADESAYIGPSPAQDSYLNIERILEAARATGADAVHPGYGFLSENAAFVDALSAEGITFVGPPAAAIRAMGLKDAAKAAMEAAGVPVVPGYHGAEQGEAHLSQVAADIGYPVMIKARAGGGGKGMRRVNRAEDFMQALSGAQREGQASFGDPAVLIEKFIEHPRHIEVQVFADTYGNYVHLHERDCSLQRRHQKVIEEAPAPGMTPDLRASLGEIALRAARAVGYVGAGTVEFIVDGNGLLRADGCWFMEMNTRLQVEHPVTEAITGIDLVEWQLLVAAGGPLPLSQDDIPLVGHAMEARLYAEDVPSGFLPATGTLTQVAFPQGASAFAQGDIRSDSGVDQGSEISSWYDPMIAKLITHGETREVALARLTQALKETQIVGPTTNIVFLHRLSTLPEFKNGLMHTGLIDQHLDTLAAQSMPDAPTVLVASLAFLDLLSPNPLRGWRAWGQAKYTCTLSHEDQVFDIALADAGEAGFIFDESAYIVKAEGQGHYRVSCDGGPTQRMAVFQTQSHVTVFQNAHTFTFSKSEPGASADVSGEREHLIHAPMPGLVKAVTCSAGDAVSKGQALLVMEAMKMEHTLVAPRDGTLAEVTVGVGAQVSAGAVLIQFEQDQDA
jgi:3-methylcrotonyl-CoA carboxylase alpha subunit